MLGSALAGMAQVAARHWLAQDGDVPEAEAARMISGAGLAWLGRRSRRSIPEAGPEGSARSGCRNAARASRVSLSPNERGWFAPLNERCAPVEVTIGVQNVARELTVETDSDPAEVSAAVDAALREGGVLHLIDSPGRSVFVPGAVIGWVQLGDVEKGRVGFTV